MSEKWNDPQGMLGHAWHTMSAEETARRLGTDLQRGLSQEEAARRLEQFGPNELAEKPRPSFWALLLSQFNNFLIIILLVASVISILLGEFIDAGESVVVLGFERSTARVEGTTFESEWVHVFTVRHGKVTRWRGFYDTAARFG